MAGDEQDQTYRTPVQQNTGVAGTIGDRLKRLDEILDEYEVKTGLPRFSEANKERQEVLERCFNFTQNQLEALTVDECDELAFILSTCAMSVRRNYNREVARVNWANSEIRKVVCDQVPQYRGSWESAKDSAIKGDEAASKLQSIAIWAKQRADRLSDLASDIHKICDRLASLRFSKQSRTRG